MKLYSNADPSPFQDVWRILTSNLPAVVFVVAATVVSAVEMGDDIATVRAELGEPSADITMGSHRYLTFERGEVELENGKVVQDDLISEEAAVERRERREREAAEQAERDRKMREQRHAEGLEVYGRKISDQAFMQAPAAERVAYWKGFKKKYPEVELGPEYEQALREYELELQARNAAQAAAYAQAPPPAPVATQPYYNQSYWRTGGSVIVNPGHGHDRPVVVNSGVKYTPVESTAGYGFQRPLNTTPSQSKPVHLPAKQPRPTPRSSVRR